MFSSCMCHKKAPNSSNLNLIDTFTERPSCHQFCVATAWPGSPGKLLTSKHTHSSGSHRIKGTWSSWQAIKPKCGILRDLNEDYLHGSQGEPQLVKQGGVGR